MSPNPIVKSAGIGEPRLDRYNRLLSRFFEPLILLEVLGATRGEHTPKRRDQSVQGLRRQFRDDLAFLCEHEKGGKSCTAIGIEDMEEKFVYWVASNSNASKKILPFLESLLNELSVTVQRPKDESHREIKEKQLTLKCITHAAAKLKKQRDQLHRFSSRSISRLRGFGISAYPGLVEWLQEFLDPQDDIALCGLAYESRKSHQMKQLDKLIQDPIYHDQPDDQKDPFSQVRHYIGRLADHIRVPKRLIEHLDHVEDLLVNTFEVQAVPVFECIPRPQPDNLTTLDAICKRMLPSGDPKLDELRNKLVELDRKLEIHERILKQYENKNFKPRVHAEIQVLEHFHSKQLPWADGDRYIGCSKPACYCCQLYFRYHPARPVEPESHLKIWLKWGPPLLKGGSKDKMFISQRNILNSMVTDIRKEAIEQIQHRRQPHPWHADSRTGITSSRSDTVTDPEVEYLVHGLEDADLSDSSAQDLTDFNDTEESSSGNSTSTLDTSISKAEHDRNVVMAAEVDEDVDTDTDGGAPL